MKNEKEIKKHIKELRQQIKEARLITYKSLLYEKTYALKWVLGKKEKSN